MLFYRVRFKNQSFPRQHFLDIHLLKWIEKRHVGEQAGEHVPSLFNSLKHSMRGVHQPLMKLRCKMREHHIRVSPNITFSFPKPKRRILFD